MLKWIKTLTNKGVRWVYVMGLDSEENTVELYMNRQEYEGEYTEELELLLNSKLRKYMRQAHDILVAEIVMQKRVHNEHTVYEYDIQQHIAKRGIDSSSSNSNL